MQRDVFITLSQIAPCCPDFFTVPNYPILPYPIDHSFVLKSTIPSVGTGYVKCRIAALYHTVQYRTGICCCTVVHIYPTDAYYWTICTLLIERARLLVTFSGEYAMSLNTLFFNINK